VQHQKFENILFYNLQEYLFWRTGKDPEEYEFNISGYRIVSDNFTIEYLDADNEKCLWDIPKKDQEEMYRFLNDPEMFSDANKYNL
jgi:hypothetical protein